VKANFTTDVICIKSGSPLSKAKELMQNKRIRHLPVINENQEVVSILSYHDFIGTDRLQDWGVDLFATTPVEYVTTDTPLRQVVLKMLNNKISSVLLTDNTNTVVGIITTHDMLYHLSDMLKDSDKDTKRTWTESDILITAGEFFRKLSDIGI